ncbi:hypothetical protein VTN00DRAFT_125 [Thermoascus crustaceus]|uniref:uncharacterized protein n=1 Tax=Thermoascus crustaceus TaxID=5088 RepID=UPI00374498AF
MAGMRVLPVEIVPSIIIIIIIIIKDLLDIVMSFLLSNEHEGFLRSPRSCFRMKTHGAKAVWSGVVWSGSGLVSCFLSSQDVGLRT